MLTGLQRITNRLFDASIGVIGTPLDDRHLVLMFGIRRRKTLPIPTRAIW